MQASFECIKRTSKVFPHTKSSNSPMNFNFHILHIHDAPRRPGSHRLKSITMHTALHHQSLVSLNTLPLIMRYAVKISRGFDHPPHTPLSAALDTFREESYDPVARHRSGQVMRQLAVVHRCTPVTGVVCNSGPFQTSAPHIDESGSASIQLYSDAKCNFPTDRTCYQHLQNAYNAQKSLYTTGLSPSPLLNITS
jgi:hypothetical protein